MNSRKKFFSAFFLSGLAFAALPANAADLDMCSGSNLAIAQCQCNIALSVGTPSALKKFLKHYNSKGTACAATASTAPSSSGSSGHANGGGNSSTGGGGNNGGSDGSGGGDDGAPKPPNTPDNPNDGTDSPPDGSGNVPKGG